MPKAISLYSFFRAYHRNSHNKRVLEEMEEDRKRQLSRRGRREAAERTSGSYRAWQVRASTVFTPWIKVKLPEKRRALFKLT